jgi:hypothetical protein
LVLVVVGHTTGRPDEPTPLLDQVSRLLGRTIVDLRFENLGPSSELALRHARTIFACSNADKEVCVRLLNELSIAPQTRSLLSDASMKATIKVFARAIAETPLLAGAQQLSEIHTHAIAGLNKFLISKSSPQHVPLPGAFRSLKLGGAPRWHERAGGGHGHQRGAVL